jgi:hypothetical protein
VHDWLASTNPAFRHYAKGLCDYGYDDMSLVSSADESELRECLDEVSTKKLHIRLILRKFREQFEAEGDGAAVDVD